MDRSDVWKRRTKCRGAEKREIERICHLLAGGGWGFLRWICDSVCCDLLINRFVPLNTSYV